MIDKLISGQPVELSTYWLILLALLVIKGICNAAADMAKHFAGFDIVETDT
jgi:ATP-binding cassette subfamily B protein